METSEFDRRIIKATGEVAELDDKIRSALVEAFNVQDEQENAGYKAAALEVVEIGVSIANLFLNVHRPEQPRSFRTILDLTIMLNNNSFWAKHAPSIVPMIQSAMLGHIDVASFEAEKARVPGYMAFEGLIVVDKAAAIPIMAYLLYLLGGPVLYATKAAQLKQALYPLFVR